MLVFKQEGKLEIGPQRRQMFRQRNLETKIEIKIKTETEGEIKAKGAPWRRGWRQVAKKTDFYRSTAPKLFYWDNF